MIKNPPEIKFGDGGHIVDEDGNVRPLQDGFDFDSTVSRAAADIIDDTETERPITQQEKIAYVYGKYEFYPKSADELGAIVGIEGVRNLDAAKFLSVVMQRQEGLDVKTSDPRVAARTARKLADEMIGYYKNARANLAFLTDLPFEVNTALANNESNTDAFGKADAGQRRALVQVLRQTTIRDFTEAEPTSKKFAFGEDVDYAKHLPIFLGSVDTEELKERATRTLIDEQNRLHYWREKLRELRKVTIIKPMIDNLLGDEDEK